TEQQDTGVGDVVDGDEVHLVDQPVGEPTELLELEQLPALLGRQRRDRLFFRGVHPRLTDSGQDASDARCGVATPIRAVGPDVAGPVVASGPSTRAAATSAPPVLRPVARSWTNHPRPEEYWS